jgi:hypothetical protein
MTELCRLAQKYGTDKYPCYTPFYDALLNQKKYQVGGVLEIGIGSPATMVHVPDYRPGASLRMWRDYFPNAQIIGVDIEPSVLFEEERIHTFHSAQSNLSGELYGWETESFDIILDDASHAADDQYTTCIQMMPYLKAGGVYIVEDTCDRGVHNENNSIKLPFVHQYVECRVPDGSQTGRLVMVRK